MHNHPIMPIQIPCGLKGSLRPFDCWDRVFQSRWWHGYSCVMQAAASGTGWSLSKRAPTGYWCFALREGGDYMNLRQLLTTDLWLPDIYQTELAIAGSLGATYDHSAVMRCDKLRSGRGLLQQLPQTGIKTYNAASMKPKGHLEVWWRRKTVSVRRVRNYNRAGRSQSLYWAT
jgi:hypothetical protein